MKYDRNEYHSFRCAPARRVSPKQNERRRLRVLRKFVRALKFAIPIAQ